MPNVTFISFVGLQPAATAVALEAWIDHHGPPDTVLLLTTDRVKAEAQRLKQQFSVPFKEFSASDPTKAMQCVPCGTIAYFADPGLKSPVAALSAVLSRRESEVLFLHADTTSLHIYSHHTNCWTNKPLVDLGLERLLALQERQMTPAKRTTQLLDNRCYPSYIHKNVNVLQSGEWIGNFDLAFESKGRLFLLTEISQSNSPRSNSLDQTRTAFAAAANIQASLAVLSNDRPVLRRATRAGFMAINSTTEPGRKRLEKWIERKRLPPIRKYPVARRDPRPGRTTTLSGKGGNGPPLCVCLGRDPSATLMSLFTHEPQQAVVYWDPSIQLIEDATSRLKNIHKELPVGSVTFAPTDHLGRGIENCAPRARGLRADITPGTKAQACSLARLPGAELWSLAGDAGIAGSVLPTPARETPLVAPDLRIQAYVVGGEMYKPRRCLSTCHPDRNFLRLVSLHLHSWIRSWEAKAVSLGDVLSGSDCLEVVKRHRRSLRIKISLGAEKDIGTLPSGDGNDGEWFELLVANAFLEAGADEVWIGVKWKWDSDSRSRRPHHRDEVDVLVRMKHRFLVVSCKTGKNPTDRRACQEIEAVALSNMGRMAVPVVVRPKLSKKTNGADFRKGAVLLDIEAIADPECLRARLSDEFRRRSTR